MSSVHVVKGAHHACYYDPSSVCPALPVEQTDDDDHPTACQDGLRSVWTSLRRSGWAMMILLRRTNNYIKITTTVHIIRHSIMADTIMSVVHIMAIMVTIMDLIITDIIEMSTIMPSAITSIVMRFAIVEKIHIIIYQIDTELPFVLMRNKWDGRNAQPS